MAIRKLVLFPNGLLTRPSELITDFGNSLQSLISDLRDTLYAGPGVGLAAPQIGELKRVSVIDVGRKGKAGEPGQAYVIVNPEILETSGAQIPREGCLSVPDLLANVRRFERVVVRAQNERGEERTIRAQGFEALALQHEIDHLEGRLFLDRVTNLKTDLFRRKSY